MFCCIVFGSLTIATNALKVPGLGEHEGSKARRNLMIKKILSLHLFAAIVCFAACDLASAQLSGCASGACGVGHGGSLLQKIAAGGCLGGCGGKGCASCAATPARMIAPRPVMVPQAAVGCAGHGMCGGHCGGRGHCGGKFMQMLEGAKGVTGLFDGGYPHSQVGGACRTCENIWDGYCASKERCLPHAKYPYQNYYGGGCHSCGGNGCNACGHGGCASGGCNKMTLFGGLFTPRAAGCGAMGCTKAGCAGGCGAAPGYAGVRPMGATFVSSTPGVSAGPVRGGQAYAFAPVEIDEQPEEPTLAQPGDIAQSTEEAAEEVADREPVLELAPLTSAVSNDELRDPIPPVPPSPAAEPGLGDQTRTGAFDWLERSLNLK